MVFGDMLRSFFAKYATSEGSPPVFKLRRNYDYIVIGGGKLVSSCNMRHLTMSLTGTAGCVLAARLSEGNSATVLLIEAGPPCDIFIWYLTHDYLTIYLVRELCSQDHPFCGQWISKPQSTGLTLARTLNRALQWAMSTESPHHWSPDPPASITGRVSIWREERCSVAQGERSLIHCTLAFSL